MQHLKNTVKGYPFKDSLPQSCEGKNKTVQDAPIDSQQLINMLTSKLNTGSVNSDNVDVNVDSLSPDIDSEEETTSKSGKCSTSKHRRKLRFRQEMKLRSDHQAQSDSDEDMSQGDTPSKSGKQSTSKHKRKLRYKQGKQLRSERDSQSDSNEDISQMDDIPLQNSSVTHTVRTMKSLIEKLKSWYPALRNTTTSPVSRDVFSD